MVVMPSDHVIKDEARFVEAVRARRQGRGHRHASCCSASSPTDAHTGYGYIRQGTALEGFDGGAFKVDAFFEKPDSATAERYLADGNYFWNSGIFVLHARTFLEELARLEPAVLEAARAALAARRATTSASCASTAPPSPVAQHLGRLRGDGEDHRRGDAADRRRLERRRLLVVAVGDRAAR